MLNHHFLKYIYKIISYCRVYFLAQLFEKKKKREERINVELLDES
jgi:hypothetical protein